MQAGAIAPEMLLVFAAEEVGVVTLPGIEQGHDAWPGKARVIPAQWGDDEETRRSGEQGGLEQWRRGHEA